MSQLEADLLDAQYAEASSKETKKQRELELQAEVQRLTPVSYTHLTLPTIYSV